MSSLQLNSHLGGDGGEALVSFRPFVLLCWLPLEVLYSYKKNNPKRCI